MNAHQLTRPRRRPLRRSLRGALLATLAGLAMAPGCSATDSGPGTGSGTGNAGPTAGTSPGGTGAVAGTGAIGGTATAGNAATSPTGGSSSGQGGTPGTGAAPGTGGASGTGAAAGTGGSTGDGPWPVPPHTPAPTDGGPVTVGGTMTFTNIGALGWWGRRIEAEPGDPRCDVQSEVIDFGWGSEFCCRQTHEVTTDRISPFNEEVSVVVEGPMRVSQFVVYQPVDAPTGDWAIRSFWDRRDPTGATGLTHIGPGDDPTFDGNLGNNCAWQMQLDIPFPCGPGSIPYCPGSGVDYYGWAGSKLFLILASMPYADGPDVPAPTCISAGETEREQDAPWIGLGASEFIRDGWLGYHPCHCFANTDGGLGDGCGQINVFEIIAEASGDTWGNRDMISTGLRSFQLGHLGGNTCGIAGCTMDHFPSDATLLDACALTAMSRGAVLDADNRDFGICPMWRRWLQDRWYIFLLDEETRTVQVAVLHPDAIPPALAGLLPALPSQVPRAQITSLVDLRLPQ